MRSQKWDRQAVPFLGPCLGSFFEVFCIKVSEVQPFGFNEALWLMATGRATVEHWLECESFSKTTARLRAVAEGALENQRRRCTSVWLDCCLEGPNDEACEEVHSDG